MSLSRNAYRALEDIVGSENISTQSLPSIPVPPTINIFMFYCPPNIYMLYSIQTIFFHI